MENGKEKKGFKDSTHSKRDKEEVENRVDVKISIQINDVLHDHKQK